jgi:hypothetical protein
VLTESGTFRPPACANQERAAVFTKGSIMHVHINHMFCTNSNWGGDFWTRYMVSLDTLKKVDQTDCQNLLMEKEAFDEDRWQSMQGFFAEQGYSPERIEQHKAFYNKKYKVLKPEVLEWLANNVPNVKDAKQPQGWCVGSDTYQMSGSTDVAIWFARRKDALNFIRTFSVHKKPTTYFDYFKEIRKELNFKKNVLAIVDDYSDTVEASIYDK